MKEKTRTAEELQEALMTVLKMLPEEQVKFFPAIVSSVNSIESNIDGLAEILSIYTCSSIFYGVEKFEEEERERDIEESRKRLKSIVNVIGADAVRSLLEEIAEKEEWTR